MDGPSIVVTRPRRIRSGLRITATGKRASQAYSKLQMVVMALGGGYTAWHWRRRIDWRIVAQPAGVDMAEWVPLGCCKAPLVPVGTVDNSPAIHRWESGRERPLRPVGTREHERHGIEHDERYICGRPSRVPTGRNRARHATPAINRWAIPAPSLRDNCGRRILSPTDRQARARRRKESPPTVQDAWRISCDSD
jgi:hypothetical protein